MTIDKLLLSVQHINDARNNGRTDEGIIQRAADPHDVSRDALIRQIKKKQLKLVNPTELLNLQETTSLKEKLFKEKVTSE